MPGRRATVDDDSRIAAGNDGGTAVSLLGAGNLVSDASDPFAVRVGGGCAGNHLAPVIGRISYDDKRSSHKMLPILQMRRMIAV